MRLNTERTILFALALLWLVLRLPHFGAHFSFDWDSSNYARGIAEFNLVKHQPHPPGYFLYVLGARALTGMTGGPMQAQIALAFALALIALAVFYALARQITGRDVALSATVLLAYSPTVSLYSSVSSPDVTDLLSSCVAGYLAFLDPKVRQWRIIACLTALGLLAGFRQSGVVLLVPLIAVAVLIHWRIAWRAICAGAILGTLAFLAWYVPLAQSVGGWRVLYGLTSEQFRSSARITSIFFGGTAHRHLGMIAENILYIGLNLCAWLLAFRLRPGPASWWRYALWLIPNLVVLFGIHGAKAGYWLLSFPPLLLLCAAHATPRIRAVVAGVFVSLAISYFPYGRLLGSEHWVPIYLVYKSTPRLALDLEASQRRLDQVLRGLHRDAVCARDLPEAPNIRTVTYDFNYLHWTTPEPTSVWLFDQRGPNVAQRERYQNWRRITGDDLISLWETAP